MGRFRERRGAGGREGGEGRKTFMYFLCSFCRNYWHLVVTSFINIFSLFLPTVYKFLYNSMKIKICLVILIQVGNLF